MKFNEVVRFLWKKLRLPPKWIVLEDPSTQSVRQAVNEASRWRHTVILLKSGEYKGETVTMRSYVDLVGAKEDNGKWKE